MRAQLECWLGSFVIFQGIWTSIAIKKTLYFCDFSGGGGAGPPVLPSGSVHGGLLYYFSSKPVLVCYGYKWTHW